MTNVPISFMSAISNGLFVYCREKDIHSSHFPKPWENKRRFGIFIKEFGS